MKGAAGEVFTVFLRLGLTSFGGPVAHVGYFRRELVERRGWFSEAQFGQLLAISQFLPGPASSQMGFMMGLLRGGWAGGAAAFLAFTLPSALLMFAFAGLLHHLSGDAGQAALHGLKLVALAVVAHGVLGMARQLCPDRERATIAALAAVVVLMLATAWSQLLVVALGALAGLLVLRDGGADNDAPLPPGPRAATGWLLIGAFALLLTAALALPALLGEGFGAVAAAFYRAGALVFGGGHVVLPLLEETVVTPGWVSPEDFLAGYGAAQAVPGPMFSFAAYLGARLPGELGGAPGAAVAISAIFLPGLLLGAGVLPLWRAIAARPGARRAIAGVNAAVVGLLGAALYDPVWTSAVGSPADVAIALAGFTLLAAWRASALVVVGWCVAASVAVAMW